MLARIATKASCLLLLILISFATKAQLHTGFSATPISSCTPAIIQFTDSSKGNPTSWRWDLGNGTTSFLQNPSATYFNPGSYTIKLVIKNAQGSDSLTKTKYIIVNALPTVQFTSNITTGCYPLNVQFTDQSLAGSGSIVKWEWDFGDGYTSTQANPVHVYNNLGNFNVALRITNSNGCINTFAKGQYIQIGAGVLAGFTDSSSSSCNPPVIVNFKNTSTGTGILNYQWLFGDGASSTATNPSHTYNFSGSYTVRLITTNSNGCSDTVLNTNAVSAGSVKASFSSTDSVCLGNPIHFTNTSTPAGASLSWNFGDGDSSNASNPSESYNSSRTYKVMLVANFGTCTDSAATSVVVLPAPTAAFIADTTSSCFAPLTVNFSNQSVNASSYKWNFGDGSTSILQNPSHTYTSAASFDVSLVVTNLSGCSDSLKKSAYIKVQPPKVVFTNLPDSGCVPFTKTFNTKATVLDSVVNYLWDFGDSTTSTAAIPTHTYNSSGSYTVKLIITTAGGCTDTVIAVNGIVVTTIPIANFSATPRNTCAMTLINFSDSSTGNTKHWLWSFGDGSTSTIENPSHIYNDTGFYDVQLIAWNRGCPDTLKLKNYIFINPPIAKFIVTNICDSPYTKIFTDQSIGSDTWSWNFGDGTTSTIQSPEHTYADTGTYTISLTVTNDTTNCSYTTTKTIKVVYTKANFYASDTIVCKGNPILFTDPSGYPGNISSYQWNFQNGIKNSSANSISYTYGQAGTYTVSLIITNILGCKDTLTKNQYIRVNGPTAKFGISGSSKCVNSTIQFSDSSVSDGLHPIQTWIWNYGDGKTDTLSILGSKHLYAAAGSYTVWLKTIDNQGCVDSFKLPTALVISKPIAAFVSIDTLTCPNQLVNLIDSSIGSTLTYLWNFGDSSTSNNMNPIHSYTSDGLYTIKLNLTDQFGCTDSITKQNYIDVTSPVASFIMDDSTSTCPPLLVHFTNLSINADSTQWDFGDGSTSAIANPTHFYTNAGTYTVKLTITSTGGCIAQYQSQVKIQGPSGKFSYTPLVGCSPVNVNFVAQFNNITSVLWDFNDGTTISTVSPIISHSYTHTGSYIPKVILSDANGCQVPIVGSDSVHIYNATAKFGFINKTFCDSASVIFADSSTSNDIIASYSWNFGDGDTSILQDPVHQYDTTGIYYPTLTVTTEIGCTNTKTATTPIRIVASPQAGITSSGNGCTPLNTIFNGQLLLPDTSSIIWNWDFGNGVTSTLQNPNQQTYSTAGVYKVLLKITNSTGCSDTASTTIEAYLIPTVYAGPDTTICQNRGITLNPSGADSYSWSPSDGLSCANCTNPVATPATETKYYLLGTTIHGCSAKDSIDIKVKYPFTMNYSQADSLCKGTPKELFASGANSYEWTPSEGLSSISSATPTATPDTTTTYQVVGTDNLGCFSDTGFVYIKIYPIPTVDAGPDRTINVGQTIDLVPIISNDVTSVIWSPTGTLSRNIYPAITVSPIQTTEYTVNVKNNGGCTASDRLTIYVVCNGANVFIPNTFSPNGDGANDVFYPRGTGLFSIKSFRIFNRWGEVVFEKQNFMPNDATYGWDGTFKGVKLTSDVYVYTIDIVCDNSSVLTFNGNVALVK